MDVRRQDSDIVVVGAGVSGLTTARTLQERGLNVSVVADTETMLTTSRVASAVWHIYLVELDERVRRWGSQTLLHLMSLASDPQTGVVMRRGREFLRAEPEGDPGWRDLVPHFRWLRRSELPRSVVAGYEVDVPVADMAVYLPWLRNQVDGSGGTFSRRRVADLAEVSDLGPVVVNCMGLGARDALQDLALTPVQGQMAIVDLPAGVADYIGDDDDPDGMTFFIPRITDVAVGGTAHVGREDLEYDLDEERAILRRAAALEPLLAGARVRERVVGVRPVRGTVRLEREAVSGRNVVHNYGHGGSGFSLSWGCAAEAAELVTSVI